MSKGKGRREWTIGGTWALGNTKPKGCSHMQACTYGRTSYKGKLCSVWWCHHCGALAIIRAGTKGRPAAREYWNVIPAR